MDSSSSSHHRHSSQQIARLEQFFLGCTNPDAKQREDLGAELGLDPSQIKFWFQNRRTKEKSLNKRYDNNTLRAENQQIEAENRVLKETLKNTHCPTCREESHISIDKLRVENALLHQQIEKVSMLLANNCGISSSSDPAASWRTPPPMAMMHSTSASSSSSRPSSLYQNIAATHHVPPTPIDDDTPPPPPHGPPMAKND